MVDGSDLQSRGSGTRLGSSRCPCAENTLLIPPLPALWMCACPDTGTVIKPPTEHKMPHLLSAVTLKGHMVGGCSGWRLNERAGESTGASRPCYAQLASLATFTQLYKCLLFCLIRYPLLIPGGGFIKVDTWCFLTKHQTLATVVRALNACEGLHIFNNPFHL